MQKCPKCRFRKTSVEEIRHEDDPDKVVGSITKCENCGHILKKKIYPNRL